MFTAATAAAPAATAATTAASRFLKNSVLEQMKRVLKLKLDQWVHRCCLHRIDTLGDDAPPGGSLGHDMSEFHGISEMSPKW